MSPEQKKTLDRIRKLIALSSSDNESEARNAAYQACKLIREKNVVLGFKRVARKRPSSGARTYSRPAGFSVDDIVRETEEIINDWFDVGTSDVWMGKNKYGGVRCGKCGGVIPSGARIVYIRKDKKAFHEGCYQP